MSKGWPSIVKFANWVLLVPLSTNFCLATGFPQTSLMRFWMIRAVAVRWTVEATQAT